MSDELLTTDEAQAFLDAHPTVEWIDLLLFDLNGIARGKRIRRADLLSAAHSGIMLPASVFIMDPRGNCIEETGRLWETGDPDLPCRLLAGTLRPVPVGAHRHAQAVIAIDNGKDVCDPRAVLAEQVERFSADGFTPVAALELEFYVTASVNGEARICPPAGVSDDPERPMTFGFDDMDALAPFIDDIYRIAEAQGLPVDAVIQESGPGQFEINLKHRPDPVAAALDALLLKRAVKAAAGANGIGATFMSKPHHDWCGSGMHVHLSLLDSAGRNVFTGHPISPLCRHAIAGLQATMADFMAIWAQTANAYRRYVPKSYVSLAPHWGFNNRTVALRIPGNGHAAATRIEHRVAGADANPYLVVAAILAGIRHGIAKRIDPSPPTEGNAEEIDAPPLPTAWINALEKFEKSAVVRDAFGAGFQDVYQRLKTVERTNFERIVTSLDHLWYSQVA